MYGGSCSRELVHLVTSDFSNEFFIYNTAVFERSSRLSSGLVASVHVQSLEAFLNSQTNLDQ